ncbi:Fis family transcriptional regulator [Thiomicrospira aerophila AL3]|uniref:Fis family transcriptional regulator n=1 Tax=Thiomicrospira aerophila AL3 TaxID=717772 RepID=W0DSH5_9GAMM|nr:sigma-54 dependent transcriptional regulator [Thiomicrospira aerophila]AHF01580.1 Fis family transcriptional regulator [Thiomicrospira aerophila AL3]
MFETKILVVEDDPALQEALVDILSLHDFEVVAVSNAEDALVALNDEIGMVFSDIRMDGLLDGYQLMQRIRALKPHLPIVLMTAYGTIEQAVSAMKFGAVDYLVKPFEATVLVEKARLYFQRDASQEDGFIAVDPKTQQIKKLADKVAKTEASVLIQGASGSGKEVLARYVHQQSNRAAQPFVAINCAAIPDNMIEAVLFGYEKGAFTGALKSMPGKFEQAQGGTLFLDEIGELKADLQAKLLRVLQEREVERIGATKTIQLDVRIISATNIDMPDAIAEGRFREDLFYRLNVFPLTLPSLAERPADIAPIAMRLIARYQTLGQPCEGVASDALERLASYAWPGNIRELDNVIQRAMVMRSGSQITADDLLFDQMTAQPASQSFNEGVDLKTQEMNAILSVLKKHQGHRQKTAGELNLSTRTLRYKLAKYKEMGLDID